MSAALPIMTKPPDLLILITPAQQRELLEMATTRLSVARTNARGELASGTPESRAAAHAAVARAQALVRALEGGESV